MEKLVSVPLPSVYFLNVSAKKKKENVQGLYVILQFLNGGTGLVSGYTNL